MVAHLAQRFGHPDATDLAGDRQTRRQRQRLVQTDGELPRTVAAGNKIAEALELDLRIRQEPGLPQTPLGFLHGETRRRQITVAHQRRLHRAFQRQLCAHGLQRGGQRTEHGNDFAKC